MTLGQGVKSLARGSRSAGDLPMERCEQLSGGG
jgi:hypothetical protein